MSRNLRKSQLHLLLADPELSLHQIPLQCFLQCAFVQQYDVQLSWCARPMIDRTRQEVSLQHLQIFSSCLEVIQWKYLMYCPISTSLKPWFGIGTLLYSFSIALASGSVSSIFSGSLSQSLNHASLRRLVTPAISGPSFLPSPTEWQARHLLSKLTLP